MKWNLFKKNNPVNDKVAPTSDPSTTVPATPQNDEDKTGVKDKVKNVGMNMMQRIAMKKLAKMGPAEQAKMMRDMLKPENKGKLLEVMEMMKKSGQISEEQFREAKKRLGIM